MSSYVVTISAGPGTQKYANVTGEIYGSASVSFSPTSAISAVSMSLALSSADTTFISAISANRSFPATMTSAAPTINFIVTSRNLTLSTLGIYDGGYSAAFLISALGTGASRFATASADTITASQSASYVKLSDVYTQTILWPTEAERARLYTEGAF